jgi:hypothetical protein
VTDFDRSSPGRTAAPGAAAFAILFALHHALQGFGPTDTSPAGVAAYQVAHRGLLLGSEVALALALLAFLAFLAPAAVAVRAADRPVLATALLSAGTTLVTLGFVSTAAETALVHLAGTLGPDTVAAVDQLQGRVPVVWSVAALTFALSLAGRGTGLLPRPLATTGLVLAAVFLLAGLSNLVGAGVEGPWSLVGIGLFVVWMLAVAWALWRTDRPR